ncbi:RNA-binding domain-containing protein [Dacryopinax primogenitus]|uniref:RNA-binding domain-containing protein n=1 Tax=Dacryopinax primogenitus (strain DJM 731) TaxID=1858805 RepID=M5GDD5_DACPD|nr:RNA-binding domain-containing protein [Dacryopinax primogenitus]EJU02288.1 RNA-binding domain-containing protein [Dacryopinax primogenitus]
MATARAAASGSGVRSPNGRDTRTQLYVGNLPYRVRWQDLKDLFRKAGTVLRADVSLGSDNRSRGYGTVLLATAEDAGRAIDMFNGYVWQTRTLEVRPDRLPPPDPEHQNPAAGPSPLHAMPYVPPTNLAPPGPGPGPIAHGPWLNIDGSPARPQSALPFHVQWQDLKDHFRSAGQIARADVATGPDGRSRGFGTVLFVHESDALAAVEMFNGFVVFLS